MQAANDPRRKGILVPLGQDCSLDLLKPVLGLPATALHRNGQQVLVWRPHVDFATCLPEGIKCPCCKTNTLSQHEATTRNVRKVMARDRTILMIGCVYKCKPCAGGCLVHLFGRAPVTKWQQQDWTSERLWVSSWLTPILT